MDIMDLASKGIVAITKNFGKKVCKKQGKAPEIAKAIVPMISRINKIISSTLSLLFVLSYVYAQGNVVVLQFKLL